MSSDEKIIQMTHNLLVKLFQLFPLERVNKIRELDVLYSKINSEILAGLNAYEKNKSPVGKLMFKRLNNVDFKEILTHKIVQPIGL